MICPISFEERIIKRTINPDSKFILIGNTIDGFLDFKFQEFNNFNEVKEKLFDILYNIKCAGEWKINLYQVKDNYKIKLKYGCYKVPDRGKLIYSYSYMNSYIKQINFEKNMIIFFNALMDYEEDWSCEGEDFHKYSLYVEILKIKIK